MGKRGLDRREFKAHESTISFPEFRTGDRYKKDKLQHRVAIPRSPTLGPNLGRDLLPELG